MEQSHDEDILIENKNINEENKDSKKKDNDEINKNTRLNAFECSICLEIAKEPIVTKCGHLFCWECIYNWNQQKKTCPNCNNTLNSQSDMIPVYNKDQNSKNTTRFKIPRPKAERNTQSDNSNNNSNSFFNHMNFGVGFFGFPFFGMSFNVGGGNGANTNNTNNMNTQPFNLQNVNIFPDNENLNKAARHLIVIIVIFLFYFTLI